MQFRMPRRSNGSGKPKCPEGYVPRVDRPALWTAQGGSWCIHYLETTETGPISQRRSARGGREARSPEVTPASCSLRVRSTQLEEGKTEVLLVTKTPCDVIIRLHIPICRTVSTL